MRNVGYESEAGVGNATGWGGYRTTAEQLFPSPRERGRSECQFYHDAGLGQGQARGTGLCSPGSGRGLDHEPRQKVPRDAATTTCPVSDLSSAAPAGIGGRHLRGDSLRRARSSLRDSGPASSEAGRNREAALSVRAGPPGEPLGKLRSQRGSESQQELELDGASVSPPWRPRYRARSSHPAAEPRARLRTRTCPAAASPAPPASAPASRPRRAGSRIPIGARGAHTDPTGPRAACQACPSPAGGGSLARAQARRDPALGALWRRELSPKPIPGVPVPRLAVRLFPGLG